MIIVAGIFFAYFLLYLGISSFLCINYLRFTFCYILLILFSFSHINSIESRYGTLTADYHRAMKIWHQNILSASSQGHEGPRCILGGSDVHRSDVLGQPRRVVLGKSRRDVPSGGHVEMLWRQQTCRIKTNMASDQCVIVCFAASAAERFPRAAWYLIPSLISHLHCFFWWRCYCPDSRTSSL